MIGASCACGRANRTHQLGEVPAVPLAHPHGVRVDLLVQLVQQANRLPPRPATRPVIINHTRPCRANAPANRSQVRDRHSHAVAMLMAMMTLTTPPPKSDTTRRIIPARHQCRCPVTHLHDHGVDLVRAELELVARERMTQTQLHGLERTARHARQQAVQLTADPTEQLPHLSSDAGHRARPSQYRAGAGKELSGR
jgi:hypothetical protein